MPRSSRNFDWMVTAEGYQPVQSDQLLPDSINIFPLNYSSGALAALVPGTEASRILGTFEAGDNWTLEAVTGDLMWQIQQSDTIQSTSYRAVLTARLEVFQASSDGTPMIALDYSLENPIYANRQYLWQRSWHTAQLASLVSVYQGRQYGSFFVNCKAKRRIQTPDEVVCLVIQWAEDQNWSDGPIPRLFFSTGLRVLGSKART